MLLWDSPFCGEKTFLEFELRNISSVESEVYFMKLVHEKEWQRIESLAPHSSRVVRFPYLFEKAGRGRVPSVRLKSYSGSGLHFFWKTFGMKEEVLVLPTPKDYGVVVSSNLVSAEESELSDLEEILDPSRFKFTDPKLYSRTGKRYQRVFISKRSFRNFVYDWDELGSLSLEEKCSQFSWWLKLLIEGTGTGFDGDVFIRTPFISLVSPVKLLDVSFLKKQFALWYDAQHTI